MVLKLKTNNDTFKCDIHLTVRVCTTKRLFSEHVFQMYDTENEKKNKLYKFLNLCDLST